MHFLKEILAFLLIFKTATSFPTYITNSELTVDETSNSPTYDDDYYVEDYEKLKPNKQEDLENKRYLKFLENYINYYINAYFEKHKFYEVDNNPPNNQFDDDLTGYQSDDSGVNNRGANFQNIGNYNENLTSDNCSDCYEKLNATLAEFLKNSTSSLQTPAGEPVESPDNWMQRDNIDTTLQKRNRQELNHDQPFTERDKESRKKEIKDIILKTVGREDISRYQNFTRTSISPSVQDNFFNRFQDINAEKYQSFIPKCEIPKNTDLESWTETTNMNLYFNINMSNTKDGLNLHIAKATLRLYKISPENISQSDGHSGKDGENTNLSFLDQEDRQIRVSIYWYIRSLKKKRVKRRLADSKMIYMYNHGNAGEWVEFNIRPAAKNWLKSGRNLGLGIVIEDQEGNTLPADRYFKNMDCLNDNQASQVIASLKPIPEPIFAQIFNRNPPQQPPKSNDVDKPHNHNRKHHDRQHRSGGGTGINLNQHTNFSAASLLSTDAYNSIHYLPTVSLCTIEIPANIDKARMNEIKRTHCNFDLNKYLSALSDSVLGSEQPVQNDSPPESTTHRVRHHHPMDPRDNTIQNKQIVLTNKELEKWRESIQNSEGHVTETNQR